MSGAGASLPPPSAEARTAAAAARVSARRVAQPNGWWGMVLFLCAEATLFGTIIGSYFYLEFGSRRWPPAGVPNPEVIIPSIATGVLVAFTPLLVAAVRAARRGHRWRAVQWISAALIIQCLYLATQILLFRHDIRAFSPKATAYGSMYFTLLAADHAHVLFGILLDLVVLYKLIVNGLDNYWLIGVRGLGLYWCVVNLITVAVLFTVISPSL
jgi:heme/copper-type cytochrome/quinol oxidase subunit 3